MNNTNNSTIIRTLTECRVKDLGLIDYQEAYGFQKRCVDEALNGGPQTLLLCEHPMVLTLGRLADEKNILLDDIKLNKRKIKVYHIDRGGEVTLHAPGQLVVYPILDLANFGKDLRRYLQKLEQVAIDLLGDFGIVANRFSGHTGVWIEGKKIVSIGIGVRKWISFHGLAINVNTDLEMFSMINPCGLDVKMTSIRAIKPVAMAQVKERIVGHFCRIFQLDYVKD